VEGLKIRVWDKEEERIITDEQEFIPLKITNKGVLKLSPTHKEELWILIPFGDRFEPMESTGVKDINKKESYLGDILKEHLTEWSSKKDIEHSKKCFCIIKKESNSNNMYLEYNFNVRGYWETNNLVLGRIENYEIVGDIYNNADVIKKEV